MHGGYRPIPKGYSYPMRILHTIRVRRKRKTRAFAAGISFPLCVLSSRALHPTTTTTKLTQATILFFVLVFQTCFQYAMSSTICCFTSCMLRMVISRQKKKEEEREKQTNGNTLTPPLTGIVLLTTLDWQFYAKRLYRQAAIEN